MLITLNQKEIETMILAGLADMGIPHDGADITMIAGRSPNGMTAEIKLIPAEVVIVTDTRESFSGDRAHPAPQAEKEETKTKGKEHSDEEPIKNEVTLDDNDDEPADNTSLFEK